MWLEGGGGSLEGGSQEGMDGVLVGGRGEGVEGRGREKRD